MKNDGEKREQPRLRHSIFSKMLTGYIALTVLIVSVTGAVSYLLVESYMLESTKKELLQKADSVASMFDSPNLKNRSLSPSRLDEIQVLTDAQAIFVETTETGHIVGKFINYSKKLQIWADEEQFELRNIVSSLDVELVGSILAGQSHADIQRLEFMNADVVFAGAPVYNSDGLVTGGIILLRPLGDVSAIVGSIVSMEALAGAGALLIAIAIAWLISRALTRPLRTLNEAAGRVAEGHYGEVVLIAQGDEIGQLGMTMNLLSSRLKDVIGTLSDEKSKLEQILSGIGEGIIAMDLEGHVVHHNPAALKLLNLPEWKMRARSGLFDHQEQLMDMLGSAIEEGSGAHTCWTGEDKATIDALVTPYYNEHNEIIGAVALLRDVSESARLEQMRRDYIANISHELRTPLTGIRGMVEPLLDGLMETEQERLESYTVIYQETLRLERLIGEMLDMSRLQEGRVSLELEPMEPEGLLEAAARRVRARAEKDGIDLVVEVPEGENSLMGDENRIIQVLTILLDNALSFTPAGGKVTLFARREKDKVALGVSDTGAGIDPDDLPFIWERFYKADRSRMRTTGTGLGLAIAKLVVELMNGQISVETEPEKGSTFTFTLDATPSDGEKN